MWDSGVRLVPGDQVLYLGQLSEEVLVQRLGLFSYWRSTAVEPHRFRPFSEPLGAWNRSWSDEKLLLIRSLQAD